MARGLNKAMIIGNVGRDPEIRHTATGSTVANLSVATSETWNDKNTGKREEKTEWHKVVAFGKLAEIIEKYVHKGTKVYVEGKLQTRSWDKDGVKMYSTEINARDLQMLDGKGDGQAPAPRQQPRQAETFDDPDLPF